jgi:hypothetical protein
LLSGEQLVQGEDARGGAEGADEFAAGHYGFRFSAAWALERLLRASAVFIRP